MERQLIRAAKLCYTTAQMFRLKEVSMNPARDVLYQVHQCQAKRRSQTALPYDQFLARLPATYETDLTSLLLPPAEVTIQIQVECEPKFQLGKVCITASAANAVPSNEVLEAIARHAAGDWGALDEHDRQENERALGTRGRLLSTYQASNGNRFYIITDAGWLTTTLLLPEDY
jgi:hypothetical protein